MEASFISASSLGFIKSGLDATSGQLDEKVDRLERQLAATNRKLDQEVSARKRMQDVLRQAGLPVPQDFGGE